MNRLPRQPDCHPCLTHRWVTEGLFFFFFFYNRTITQHCSWEKGWFKLNKGMFLCIVYFVINTIIVLYQNCCTSVLEPYWFYLSHVFHNGCVICFPEKISAYNSFAITDIFGLCVTDLSTKETTLPFNLGKNLTHAGNNLKIIITVQHGLYILWPRSMWLH